MSGMHPHERVDGFKYSPERDQRTHGDDDSMKNETIYKDETDLHLHKMESGGSPINKLGEIQRNTEASMKLPHTDRNSFTKVNNNSQRQSKNISVLD